MLASRFVRHVRIAALSLAALTLAAGCSASTEPTTRNVDLRRATWTQTRPADYSYDYQVGGGFFIEFAGRWIHVVVRGNAVVAATDVATGVAMPEPLTTWPTIEQLFDEAQQAAQNGSLTRITYDPQYGYPTEMDIAGPPDASGAIYAKSLTPAP